MPVPDESLVRFRRVVAAALAELENRRQEVNDLNVFPVADGDTGDNMVQTLRSVMQELDRLAEDHENARALADGLAELGCEVVAPQTNLVIFSAPAGFVEAMGRRAVELTETPDGRVRAVTHLDVGRADVEEALKAASGALLT